MSDVVKILTKRGISFNVDCIVYMFTRVSQRTTDAKMNFINTMDAYTTGYGWNDEVDLCFRADAHVAYSWDFLFNFKVSLSSFSSFLCA